MLKHIPRGCLKCLHERTSDLGGEWGFYLKTTFSVIAHTCVQGGNGNFQLLSVRAFNRNFPPDMGRRVWGQDWKGGHRGTPGTGDKYGKGYG